MGIMSSMILAIASTKGGVGKTTISIELAMMAVGYGHRVLLLDADPQGSTTAWAQTIGHDGLTVRSCPDGVRALHQLIAGYDAVIIDTAGAIIPIVTMVVRAADSVLIPIGPSPLDIWATKSILNLCTSVGTPAGIVIARAQVGTTLARESKAAAGALGTPIVDTRIGQRTGHVQSIMAGELPDGVALEEITDLYHELSDAGWLPPIHREDQE